MTPRIGPHHGPHDGLRQWIQWLKTSNHRTLYDPDLGFRRQASWDDHGEHYPFIYQGPDLWLKVTVPKGVHRVSLYFFNKDGHGNKNRFRDFPIEVTPYTPSLEHADRLPVLARARVHDFWGGVYKSFAVRGPNDYWFHIKKNHSYDTILSAAMIQRLRGPRLWTDVFPLAPARTGNKGYDPPDISKIVKRADQLKPAPVSLAVQLWDALAHAWVQRGTAAVAGSVRLLAYRAAAAHQAPKKWLAHARWSLPLWAEPERRAFGKRMQHFWQVTVKKQPLLGLGNR